MKRLLLLVLFVHVLYSMELPKSPQENKQSSLPSKLLPRLKPLELIHGESRLKYGQTSEEIEQEEIDTTVKNLYEGVVQSILEKKEARLKGLFKDIHAFGLDITILNRWGTVQNKKPLLLTAIKRSSDNIIKLLINKGLDVDEAGNNGWTPLMEAVVKNNYEIVKELINKKVDVNQQDVEGGTAFNLIDKTTDKRIKNALEARSIVASITDELLKDKEKVKTDDYQFASLERSSSSESIVERIAKSRSNIVPKQPTIEDLVEKAIVAIISSNKEELRTLFKLGITPGHITAENITLFDVALGQGNIGIIELCEREQIKVNEQLLQQNKQESPALLAMRTTQVINAIDAKDASALEKLLEGIDINAVDKDVKKPLLNRAVEKCSRGVITVLLNKKIDINKTDENGWTPLMIAVVNNTQEIIELLLSAGANPAAQNALGYTAADIANQNKREKIADLIQDFMRMKALTKKPQE